MLTLNLTAVNSAASQLPFTVKFNTNTNINVKNNSAQITTPGIYEIVGEVNATSTAQGDFGIYIFNNGDAYGNAYTAYAAATDLSYTIPIYTAIDVINSSSDDFVTLTFVPTGTPDIVNGTISIKKIS